MRAPSPFSRARFAGLPLLTLVAVTMPSTTLRAEAPTCGIFVSATGGTDAAGCGLDPTSPCATIAYGMSRAIAEAQSCVLVQAGNYSGPLVVPDGLTIRGGYNATWSYADRGVPGHRVVVSGGLDAAIGEYLTVRATASSATLENLEIRGPDASGNSGGSARSSHAVYANGAMLALAGVTIVAGDGANGAAGADGTDATQSRAGDGGPGGAASEYPTVCDDASHGAAGSAGTNGSNAALAGGIGGPGGTMDTDCTPPNWWELPNLDARPGSAGANAATYSGGPAGAGGPGGSACGPAGVRGNDGVSTNGLGGAVALAGGTLAGALWVPRSGGNGALGSHGTGGGGGGGSGGCDTGTDSHGAGGGGGGAGGVRAPVAGTGGKGGGGSFCVFAVNSTVTATNCEFVRGTGGNGGAGGDGGNGQPGGLPGPGGLAAGESQRGGDGGAGADGGDSGGAGGGPGGVSFAILWCGGSFTHSGSAFSGGAAGSGGVGGTAAPGGVAGPGGPSGILSTVRNCSEAGLASDATAAGAATAPAFALARGGAVCDPAPCLTVDVLPGGEAVELAFAGALPNPARGGAVFHFSLPERATARIGIFDAGGRAVRVLHAGSLGAGRHAMSWDGRNAAGEAIAAGVYFARFQAMGRTFSRRFTLVR